MDVMQWALRRGNPATVEIYDAPEPGRTAKELQAALAALHPQRLLITINSACGTFAQGLDLYDVLSHGSGEVKTFTTFAANGGALVAMAAGKGNRYIAKDGLIIVQAPMADRVEAKDAMIERLQTLTYETCLILSSAMGYDTETWRDIMERGTAYDSDAAAAAKPFAIASVSTIPEVKAAWAAENPQAHFKRRQSPIEGRVRLTHKNAPIETW